MAKTRPPYSPEFRRQMVELVRAGRDADDLAREFEPTAVVPAIRECIVAWCLDYAADPAARTGHVVEGSSIFWASCLNHATIVVGVGSVVSSAGEKVPSATWTPSCRYASNCSSS
jgi:hypothetical protein